MSFSIINDFEGKNDINSYINNYNSINNVHSPLTVDSNFSVIDYNSNCFFCTSVLGKIYIVLPFAKDYKGFFFYFVNITNNELISVSDLTSLTHTNNVVNYNSLTSTILNASSQYFSVLISDGMYWYKIN